MNPGKQATTTEAQPASRVRLAVVIVSYNTRKLIRRCIESLQAFPPRGGFEVWVVDNASRDDSVAMLRSEFPAVHVQANADNLGYAAAVNQALEASHSDYLLVLNPDIVVREGSLDRLLDFMDAHPDGGIAAAKLLNTDGTLQHSCRSFYTPRTLLLRRTPLGRLFPNSRVIRHHLLLDYDHATPRAVDWVIGACMMVRRAAADAVGGMDERFFLYFEDVDWCYRMSRQGWKVYYVPRSEMVHEHRRASAKPKLSRSFWAHLGSLLRFYEKWNRYAYGIKRYRTVIKVGLFALADLAALNLAFMAAYGFRSAFATQFQNPLYGYENYVNFHVFINIVALLTLYFTGQYRIERGKPAADEFVELGRALFLAVVVLMASTYIARERLISRAVVVLFFVFGLSLVWLFRRALRALHRRVLEMRLDLRRLAIVGTESEARVLRASLARRPELGLDVVGFVDPEARTRGALGTLTELPDVVREHRIQQVVVAASAARIEPLAGTLAALGRRAVDVQMITNLATLLGPRARVERLADVPVLAFGRDTLYPVQRLAKRGMDIAVALLLLLLGSPFAVLYWLAAKVRGVSLIRTETRLGRDACPFELPVVQSGLRLPPSDLVNLPLWLAVLAGRMSLVGPWPLPPAWNPSLLDWQRLRFEARPGVTGFWRALDDMEFDRERVLRLDLYYVQNGSLGLDFRLLLRTAIAMLRGHTPGAAA